MTDQSPCPVDKTAEELYILAQRIAALSPASRAAFEEYLESLIKEESQMCAPAHMVREG